MNNYLLFFVVSLFVFGCSKNNVSNPNNQSNNSSAIDTNNYFEVNGKKYMKNNNLLVCGCVNNSISWQNSSGTSAMLQYSVVSGNRSDTAVSVVFSENGKPLGLSTSVAYLGSGVVNKYTKLKKVLINNNEVWYFSSSKFKNTQNLFDSTYYTVSGKFTCGK